MRWESPLENWELSMQTLVGSCNTFLVGGWANHLTCDFSPKNQLVPSKKKRGWTTLKKYRLSRIPQQFWDPGWILRFAGVSGNDPIWPPKRSLQWRGFEPEKRRVVLRAHDFFGWFVFQLLVAIFDSKFFDVLEFSPPEIFHLVFFGRSRGRFFLDRQRWWLPRGDFTLPRNFTSLQTMKKKPFQHAILNIYGILTYPSGLRTSNYLLRRCFRYVFGVQIPNLRRCLDVLGIHDHYHQNKPRHVQYPDTQCMVYLPTFTIEINQT